MSAQSLIERLRKVRRNGEKRWMACCPAHEDRDPSLAVQETDDGLVLIKCFAGCGAADVMAAVGLSLTDLFPNGAIAHQLKGWAQTIKRAESSIADNALLAIADTARQEGKRLTPKEREAELQAFLRVRAKPTTKAIA